MKEKNKSKSTKRIIAVLNNAYLICIVAFLFLAMSAYRNLIFLSLVCFPVFHLALFMGFKKWPGPKAKYSRGKVRWESADCGVVVLHRGIEISAFH